MSGELVPDRPKFLPNPMAGRDLDPDARDHFLSLHVGPLPPPDVLAGYNALVPNFAKRLAELQIKRAEQSLELEKAEAEHRHELDRSDQAMIATDVLAQRRIESRGQFLAATGVPVTLIFCAYLAYLGFGVVAAGVAGTLTVALVTAFIWGRVPRPEVDKLTPQNPPPAGPAEPQTSRPPTTSKKRKPRKGR